MMTDRHAKAIQKNARIAARRISNDTLLHYAAFLPDVPRAILTAHLDRGMTAQELAVLHRVTPHQMRRRLDRLRNPERPLLPVRRAVC